MSTGPSLAFSLPTPAEASLTGVLVFAAAIWIGGIVAIIVVAIVARATLGTAERVRFFRGLGRAYGPVGGIALVIALASGAVLAAARPWNGALTASAVVAAVLVACTAAGVVQARRMTRLRQAALREPGNPRMMAKIRQGARNAAALRASIATLSLALLALGVVVAV
ncbi:MAG: hypothetical protein ACRDNW_10795 [Trebonia sp.]